MCMIVFYLYGIHDKLYCIIVKRFLKCLTLHAAQDTLGAKDRESIGTLISIYVCSNPKNHDPL